ncbi:hypothetical protein B9G98_03021 [Wickerhamiella sorbophila]|uniref:Enoyl reductase (ER) domain-containing protein n=1 Tax=Wickerhamiella sorbophila TaxID=45607 RepID=A0A2T0FK85_9ASCO|nr:hypothetical protein B9G98_03021 [Wickerhamiella sorbophila]PRT55401.1 hypothetical protein B9G98_03021 [Wickerhamiella sorbophila]
MSTRPQWYAVNKQLVKKEVPIPTLAADEALIKVKAIAFNPTDFKHVDFEIAKNSGVGCDFAGDVLEIGSAVTNVKVGESVATFISSGNDAEPSKGAYSTIVKVKADSLIRFPRPLKESSGSSLPSDFPTTYEQAASLPCALVTVALAYEEYNLWDISAAGSHKGYAVIYGAVSSLGFQAAQIAKHLGFTVIAIASKKHAKLLESVGITHVVDYHDKDFIEQVRKIGGDEITFGYDAISFDETYANIVQMVSTTKPVKINLSLPGLKEPKKGANVTVDIPLAYLIEDKEKDFAGFVLKGKPNYITDRPRYINHLSQLIADKQLKSLPVKVVGQGIDAVPAGVDAIRKGVSGEKIAIRLY